MKNKLPFENSDDSKSYNIEVSNPPKGNNTGTKTGLNNKAQGQTNAPEKDL
jgi:hypothetical protein